MAMPAEYAGRRGCGLWTKSSSPQKIPQEIECEKENALARMAEGVLRGKQETLSGQPVTIDKKSKSQESAEQESDDAWFRSLDDEFLLLSG